ncbi:MAG TPA: hypothetical protein VK934_08335 [Fimbriimonas sp.]|nr:hypothetical protein [Fimbriimonas sp.]
MKLRLLVVFSLVATLALIIGCGGGGGGGDSVTGVTNGGTNTDGSTNGGNTNTDGGTNGGTDGSTNGGTTGSNYDEWANFLSGTWHEPNYVPGGGGFEQTDALWTFRIDQNAVPPTIYGTGGKNTFVPRPSGWIQLGNYPFSWGFQQGYLAVTYSNNSRTEYISLTAIDADTIQVDYSGRLGPGYWYRTQF